MEPITYTLSHVKTGTLRHDDDDISRVTASLYTDGILWTVVIEEENPMNRAMVKPYRATDEIRHQAVMKACMRSGKFNILQVYEALGIEVSPGGTVME